VNVTVTKGHVARMGEGRNVYRVLVGKPVGKRPLERPRRRWEMPSGGNVCSNTRQDDVARLPVVGEA
jgi:hypothetical protein